MSTIKPILYRVETYIVPKVNRFPPIHTSNEIDNVELASRLKITDENVAKNNARSIEKDTSFLSHNKSLEYTEYSAQEHNHCTSINIEMKKDLMDKKENIYDRQSDNNDENFYLDGRLNVRETKFQASIRSQDALYPARHFKRANSLISIDERSEGSECSKLHDVCRHGYKNGCTAMISSPEEVSEEVFKENWLQKIEVLRQREAAVAARETSLQSRERQLFRREREIRITERILQDKLRQVEEQLKQQQVRYVQRVERQLEEVGRILDSDEFKESRELQTNELTKVEGPKDTPSITNLCDKTKELDKKTQTINSTHSKSSLHSSARQSFTCKTSSRLRSYNSMRFKERPMVSYDDLNSTLSADVGDSSFVRTSEIFNPTIYKKPYAFTRSASERWTRQQRNTLGAKVQDTLNSEDRSQHVVEEDKVLQRLSENICATQDRDTKFQNYGLVDHVPDSAPINTECNSGNEKRFSYLNLEINHSQRKPVDDTKDRPISWNEEAYEWLQKKRLAYNLANRKSTEDKENLRCNSIPEKNEKNSKKDVKKKRFTIFR